MSRRQRGNQKIGHLGFWLGAGFSVAGMHMAARFVCEQRSVGSAVGITNPVEGVQPRRRVMSPDASCVSQVAVDLVFSADLAPWCGRRLLSFFWSVLNPRSWEFPHPEQSKDRSKAACRCTNFCNAAKSTDRFRLQSTDSSFHVFVSAQQPDLIAKTFSRLSCVVSRDLVFSGFTNNSQ